VSATGGLNRGDLLLGHFYGWQPWNGDSLCKSDVNLLWQTPQATITYQRTQIAVGGYKPGDPGFKAGDPLHDYTAVKREFDELQYWFNFHLDDSNPGDYGQWDNRSATNYGQFNPYVALVHGKEFMNEPYTYAYSVDDAVATIRPTATG